MMCRLRAIAFGGMLAGLLAGCSSISLPGTTQQAPAPKIAMVGRWLLSAANAPPCGMAFREAAGAQNGAIAPEGGCPGSFFTSRHWDFEQDELIIRDHNSEPLGRLKFVGGHFEGHSTAGAPITLSRSGPPSN